LPHCNYLKTDQIIYNLEDVFEVFPAEKEQSVTVLRPENNICQ